MGVVWVARGVLTVSMLWPRLLTVARYVPGAATTGLSPPCMHPTSELLPLPSRGGLFLWAASRCVAVQNGIMVMCAARQRSPRPGLALLIWASRFARSGDRTLSPYLTGMKRVDCMDFTVGRGSEGGGGDMRCTRRWAARGSSRLAIGQQVYSGHSLEWCGQSNHHLA